MTRTAGCRRRLLGDAGDTLVEILATIAILGIASVAIIGGLGATIRFSTTHRSLAGADVVLRAAAESVKSATISGSATCSSNTTSTYTSAIASGALPTLPANWAASNLSITTLSCPTINGQVLPQITITADNGKASDTTTVIRKTTP
jgi:type II secretory pathway pseudopilin PulG